MFLSSTDRRWCCSRYVMLLGMILAFASLAPLCFAAGIRDSLKSSDPLPDLSGLVWISDGIFVAVHDAKNPDELDRPRVSFFGLPTSLEGVLWRPADPAFPGKKSNDLESISKIPGTDRFLLSESTDSGSQFDRIFLAELKGETIQIVGETNWRAFTQPYNVEATAVVRGNDGELSFIWAERNSGKPNTKINWTKLSLDPFRIGGGLISSVEFQLPASAYDEDGKPLYDRSIVAMDVDSRAQIYVAATQDPEGFSATADDGPFRSVIYKIGKFGEGGVVLDAEPVVMGVLDGLKVESVALREHQGKREIFVGTDDENYGGILRVMPTEEAR